MRPFEFVAPRTLAEAIQAMASADGNARALAGGSDLIDQMRVGRRTPSLVVDIKNVPEMQRLEYVPGEGLHVGTGVSCTATANYPAVGEHYPPIKESCLLVGSVQIQNRASIGGNVCNASPSADTVPALLAYGARGLIAGPKGQREVLIEEFFTGPGSSVLEPDELLVEITVPPPPSNSSGHYLRFIPRNEMDIAVAGASQWPPKGESRSPIGRRRRGLHICVKRKSLSPDPTTAVGRGERIAPRPIWAAPERFSMPLPGAELEPASRRRFERKVARVLLRGSRI